MAEGRFPAPYLNTTNANDPIMHRVPVDEMGIGANSAGMPKNVNSDMMKIDHVGGTLGKGQ